MSVIVGGVHLCWAMVSPPGGGSASAAFWDTRQLSFDNYLTVCGAALFALC